MKDMRYKLFIDDLRYPVNPDWFIARTSTDAIYAIINYGMPTEIAFDHDLGGDDTSIIFIKWLEDQFLDRMLEIPESCIKYSVHSQNPIGAANIKNRMDGLNEYFKTVR